MLISSVAWGSPGTFIYQGQISKTNGEPLEANPVTFTVEILSPGAEECVLYEEIHTVNMSGSEGVFSLSIGNGVRAGVGFEDTSVLDQIFQNTGNYTPLTCAVGNSYAPVIGDRRKLRMSYDDGGGPVMIASDHQIQSVPFSWEAMTLQGSTPANFVQVNAAQNVTQANVESIFGGTGFTSLSDLIGGTSTLYVRPNGANFAPTSTIDFNNQKIENLANPTAAQDAATKNYSDSNVGGRAADTSAVGTGVGDGRVLTWNATTSTWEAVVPSATDATKLPLAGGTMSGNIDMDGGQILASGHITQATQSTITIGSYSNAQQTALVGSLGPANAGAMWFNSDSGKLMFWDGTAPAIEVADASIATGDITDINTNVGSGLSGGADSGDVTLQVVVDGSTVEIAGNTIQVKDLGIQTAKLANDAVTSAKIDDGTIATADLADSAVTNQKITSMSVDKITSGAAQYLSYMPAGTECNNNELLKWDAVADRWLCGVDNDTAVVGSALTSGRFWLGDGSNQAVVVQMSGDTTMDNAGAVTIANDAITSAKIDDGTIATVDIGDSQITTAKIADSNVTTAKLANDAVTSAKIDDGTIATADIGDSQVTTVKIADNNVTTAKINDNAVTTAKIADGDVTNAKIASVGVEKIANGAGNYFLYRPNNVDCADGEVLKWTASDRWECAADDNSAVVGSALTSANFWLGDGSNQAVAVVMSGDATMANTGAVTIANDAVTSAKIDDGTIATADIGDSQVTTAKVADSNVTTAKLANDAVTSAKIDDGTIATADIGDNQITTAKIADSNVTTAKINDNAVTTAKIADGDVTNAKIASVGVEKIANGAGNYFLYRPNNVDCADGEVLKWTASDRWECASDDNSAVVGSALTSANFWLGDGSNQAVAVVMSGDATMANTGAVTIANDAITSAKIDDGTIATADIGDSQVTTAKIADSNVTTAKLANDAVTSAKIDDGTIATADIGDSQVTTAKIADSNVTTAKLANDAVTSAKIDDGTIATADIGDSQVTTAKIADGNVTDAKIASVSVDKITSAATQYLSYMPAGTECNNNEILKWDAVADRWLCATDDNSAVVGSALTSANFWLGDGSNQAAAVVMSGDATMANTGVVTIANDAITSAKIDDGTIATADIGDSQVTTAKIADSNVTTAKIADSNVTTAKIADGDVTNAKIASVGVEKIANGAGNYFLYRPNNVDCADGEVLKWTASDRWECASDDNSAVVGSALTSANFWLGDGSNQAAAVVMSGDATMANTGVVTIANDAVTSAKIDDGTIATADIGDSQITTAKIADSNVTTAKIADSNVTTAKINDNAVTTAKIADGNVTDAKIASVSVDKITSAATQYFSYMPAGTECNNNEILKWDAVADRWLCAVDGGISDHGALGGLGDDDHTQYVMLAGRAGGQSIQGGTAASEDLTLESTSHGTKGDVLIQPNAGHVGIGTTAPAGALDVESTTGAFIPPRMTASQRDALSLAPNGSVIYNITTNKMNFKENGTWVELSSGGGGVDTTPGAFVFTDLIDQMPFSLVPSNIVTINGLGVIPVLVTISGDGSPQLRVNGGDWTTSDFIGEGQTLQLRASLGAASTLHSIVVTVGTVSTQWDVTTDDIAPESCLAILNGGGSLGDGVYTIDPEQNHNNVSTYCDMTTDGGGWTLVLQSDNTASHFLPLATGSTGTLDGTHANQAKISDAQINALMATANHFKLVGDLASSYAYIRNWPSAFNNSQRSWGFAKTGGQYCMGTSLATCSSWTNIGTYLDTMGQGGDTINRYFTDLASTPYGCYSISSSQRCVNAGASTSYQPHQLKMWIK